MYKATAVPLFSKVENNPCIVEKSTAYYNSAGKFSKTLCRAQKISELHSILVGMFSNLSLMVLENFRHQKSVSKIFCRIFYCRKFSSFHCRKHSNTDEFICRKFSVEDCTFSQKLLLVTIDFSVNCLGSK